MPLFHIQNLIIEFFTSLTFKCIVTIHKRDVVILLSLLNIYEVIPNFIFCFYVQGFKQAQVNGINLKNNCSDAIADLNQYQEAIQCYNEAISINPKSDTAWNGKGFALGNLYQYQEVIECFNEAISINPKNDSVWNWNGIALNKLKQYQNANECQNEGISINAKKEDAWNNKKFALKNLNQYQEAITCCDEAISINPKMELHQTIQINIKKQLDVTISIHPKQIAAWNNKGFTLDDLHQYHEAIKCYDEAIAINPLDDQALVNKDKYIFLFRFNPNSQFPQQCNTNIIEIYGCTFKFRTSPENTTQCYLIHYLNYGKNQRYFYLSVQTLGLGQNAYIQS